MVGYSSPSLLSKVNKLTPGFTRVNPVHGFLKKVQERKASGILTGHSPSDICVSSVEGYLLVSIVLSKLFIQQCARAIVCTCYVLSVSTQKQIRHHLPFKAVTALYSVVRYLLLAHLIHGCYEFASNGILIMVLADKKLHTFLCSHINIKQ